MSTYPDIAPAARPLTVAVGMSGGLDSSVVAAQCVEAGHKVIGLTLHLFKEGSRCCSLEDVERARRVCDHLGVPHYVINAVAEFEERIIAPFVDEYLNGRTPSPCVLCNEFIKFGTLHRRARQLGCSHVATGHYVRLAHDEKGWHLLRPRDLAKDQSYFLHRLSQEQLAHSLFPLEAWTKDEAWLYAEARGLPVNSSSKGESQDLCFVSDDGHADFVEARRPGAARPGDIVNREGQALGRHRGVHAFTIGQRRGLGVAASGRRYVSALDPARNEVALAAREELLGSELVAERMHWIGGAPVEAEFACEARIRYRHQAARVRVHLLEPDRVKLSFDEPQFAITPGQAAVLYRDDEVLGGGWIAAPTMEV